MDKNTWILRLHETRGQREKTRILLSQGFRALRTDLSEQTKIKLNGKNEVPFRPYEIVSLLVTR